MRSLSSLSVCSWDVASLAPAAHATAYWEAASHPGAAVIETCQRLEAVSMRECSHACSSRRGEDAFRYLVRLAAGVESIVLGESEIVGQVREAARTAPPELSALLGRSVAAARAFRRELGFRADSGNLFDLTIASTGRSPDHVMVVGSGPTARCLVRRVTRRSTSVTVASRRMPDWLDERVTPWISLDEMRSARRAQLGIVCLGGDAPMFDTDDIPADLLADVSTPRRTTGGSNVVTLRELRDFAFTTEASERADFLARLDVIADRALAAWADDGESPVGRFRQHAELIRREEMERIARRHPEIAADTLEAITRRLLNRLLHAPSMRMRQLDDADAATVAGLFEHEPGRTRRWPD